VAKIPVPRERKALPRRGPALL